MSRNVVAVDIDDVIVDHYESLRDWHNERYGTNHSLDDYTSDHWDQVWGIDMEESRRRAREFAALGVKHRKTKAGAAAPLHALSRDYDPVIVTVRHKVNVGQTSEWVDEQFPELFKEVRFIHVWDAGATQTKAEVCREIGADYLIDDSIKHCTQAAAAGVRAVLFGNFSWNQAPELAKGVMRCGNWDAVLQYFHERTD